MAVSSVQKKRAPRKSLRQRFGFNFYDVFVLVFCVGFALLCFYPMWYVFVASVTPYEEFVKGGLMLWPSGGVYSRPVVFISTKSPAPLARLARIRARITAKAVVHI